MSEKEIEEQKRKDSKRFLKIYMFTLTGVAILLILMSYFSQTKLTNEIESLQSKVDSTEQVASSHLSNVEKLQDLTKEQEKLIEEYETTIEELEQTIDENEAKLQNYTDFYNLKAYLASEDYEVAIPLILKLSNPEKPLNDFLKAEFDALVEDLIALEIINRDILEQTEE